MVEMIRICGVIENLNYGFLNRENKVILLHESDVILLPENNGFATKVTLFSRLNNAY